MKLNLIRYSSNEESTLGLLYIDGIFECYTLEDEYNSEKIKGETRIPEGLYKINFRKQLSPMAEKYQERYYWFKWHLEIQDIPGFTHVYIHIGNSDDDTEGCILVGNTANNNQIEDGFIGQSRSAFQDLYNVIKEALDDGEECTIEIGDIR